MNLKDIEKIEKELEKRVKQIRCSRIDTHLDMLLYSSSSLLREYISGGINDVEFDRSYDTLEFAAEKALSGDMILSDEGAIKRYLKEHREVVYEIKRKLR